MRPDTAFDWADYLGPLIAGLEEFGLQSQVLDKSKMDQNIRKAVLKNDSISQQLNLRFNEPNRATLKIKLEIDINPPAHSTFAYTYLDFPLDFATSRTFRRPWISSAPGRAKFPGSIGNGSRTA